MEPSLFGDSVEKARLALEMKSLPSSSGRFTAIGTSMQHSMAFGNWADELATRVERAVDEPLPFDRRDIHLVVNTWEPRPEGQGDPCAAPEVSQRLNGGRILQRLVVRDPACIGAPAVRDALVRLLLSGYLWKRLPAADWPAAARVAPRWLAAGLARYVLPEERAASAAAAQARWQRGSLPPLGEWLTQAGGEGEPDAEVSALLVGWLLREEEKASVMHAVFVKHGMFD